MSPNFESFVARLYVDAIARRQFLADPYREAAAAGLTDEEIAAAVRIDRVGLKLAAASFAQKKRGHITRRRSVVRLWRSLLNRLSSQHAAAPSRRGGNNRGECDDVRRSLEEHEKTGKFRVEASEGDAP
jgi:hypothetical protein